MELSFCLKLEQESAVKTENQTSPVKEMKDQLKSEVTKEAWISLDIFTYWKWKWELNFNH